MAEDVVQIALGAALDQAGGFQLRFREPPATQIMEQPGEILRRIAEAEPADGRVRKSALLPPVSPRRIGLRRGGVELVKEVTGGTAVDFQQPAAQLAFLVFLLRQWHSHLSGQLLDRLHIAEVGDLADEIDHIPAGTTAKAIVALGFRVDVKGRCLFVVEGAQTRVEPPAPPQLDVLAHHLGDVVAADHLLHIFMGNQRGHLLSIKSDILTEPPISWAQTAPQTGGWRTRRSCR